MFSAPSDTRALDRVEEGMETRDRVQRLLFKAIDEVNLGLSEDDRLQKNSDVVLVGDAGRLDSLGLINFIVAAERILQTEFQTDLSLTEMITSQDPSRYRTLDALCVTVTGMVEARRGGS